MKKMMAVAMAAALAAPAFAGDFYVGADLGRSSIKGGSDYVNGVKVSVADGNGTAVNLYGGYKLNETVSFEAGYRTLGSVTASALGANVDVKANALQISAVAFLPVSSDFSVFGRVGVNRVSLEASYKGVSNTDHTTKALVGFGGRYAINKEVGLRAEYQKQAADVSSLTVGVDYQF